MSTHEDDYPHVDPPAISGDTGLAEGEAFRPLHDHLFVRRVAALEKTEGGIVIPDRAKEDYRSCHGEVLFAGPGLVGDDGQRTPMDVQVGDTVMWDGGTGINHREYRRAQQKLVLVSERDVLFVAAESPTDEEWAKEAPRYEPGGDRYRQPDENGYWPVGKHLPQWLRNELAQAEIDGKEGRIEMVRDSGKRSGW